MPRQVEAYLEDILSAIEKIEHHVENVNKEDFYSEGIVYDAVIFNLLVIGEAAKKVPPEIRSLSSNIEWQRLAGFRDIMIHAYFDADPEIVWDIVDTKLLLLKNEVENLINAMTR